MQEALVILSGVEDALKVLADLEEFAPAEQSLRLLAGIIGDQVGVITQQICAPSEENDFSGGLDGHNSGPYI